MGPTLKYDGLKRFIKVLGLIVVIAYLIAILYVWVSADLNGYTYFTAGEPNHLIKYSEWVLGICGIFVATTYLKYELDGRFK